MGGIEFQVVFIIGNSIQLQKMALEKKISWVTNLHWSNGTHDINHHGMWIVSLAPLLLNRKN